MSYCKSSKLDNVQYLNTQNHIADVNIVLLRGGGDIMAEDGRKQQFQEANLGLAEEYSLCYFSL